MHKILKIDEVVELTRLSKSTIYLMARQGRFPAPMKLGERSSGFFEHEIEAWMQDCSNKRSADFQSANTQGGA